MTELSMGICVVAACIAVGCGSGSSCAVTENDDGSATIHCEDGTEATVRGGMRGTDGTDGTSCTVRDDGLGAHLIECDDGTMVRVTDGADGVDGVDGQSPRVSGPGLLLEVRDVGVASDRRPFVVLRFADADGGALDREGRLTEGEVTASFTIAHLPTEARLDGDVVLPYVNYLTRTVASSEGPETALQPTTDSEGVWSEVDASDGIYRYDFGAVLPEGFPAGVTHTVGIYATRTAGGARYVANAVPSFRPDGMEVTITRDVVSNEACNTCHTPLSAHGGARENVRLCATCHGAGYADPETGNTIDFRTLIHRIHRGASLPSVENGVPYEIVGYRGSVHDYSEVEFPQDIRNCETCHRGSDAERWRTVPSRAACGSCHDDVWFGAGDPPAPWMHAHEGGQRSDDDRCTGCHEPSGGLEPVVEDHLTRLQAMDAVVVDFVLNDVAIPPSGRPVIDFTVTVDGVGRDLVASPLPRFSFTVAGPTSDYAFFASYAPDSAGLLTAVDATSGRFEYELPDTIAEIAAANGAPAAATWAFGVEGYATSPSGQRYSGPNAIAYVAITDATPAPRRRVVEAARCNACHEEIGAHGGPRNDPMYCVMCHNANTDTLGRMPRPSPGDTATTTSVSFAHMIHRVHTGHDGASDYTLWSFSGSPVTFDELHYPADLRVCETCHVDDASHDLPLTDAARPARTRTIDSTGNVLSSMFMAPATSACTGCHDSMADVAHAETMTTAMGVEGCSACHASGSAFGVDVAHAWPEYDWRP